MLNRKPSIVVINVGISASSIIFVNMTVVVGELVTSEVARHLLLERFHWTSSYHIKIKFIKFNNKSHGS